MKIVSWNINGIRAALKKDNLKDFILSEKPDIIAFQEIKAEEKDVILSEHFEGYSSIWNSALKKGYSGTLILTKIAPNDFSIGIDKNEKEGRVILCKFNEFILLNIYFPNGKRSIERLQYKIKFYKDFIKFVNKLKTENANIIVLGDFNTAHQRIDLARPDANKKVSGFLDEERKLLDKLTESGFIDTYRFKHRDKIQYTWWDQISRARERNVGWRIDYIFISKEMKDKLKYATIHDNIYGADHCPVSIELK
jgi:exodeoxyribonuclease-3